MGVHTLSTLCFSHINKKTTYTDPRLAFAEDEKKTPFDFKQKFDGNSTALQVTQGKDLSGKYAIVTGANSGIGMFRVLMSVTLVTLDYN